MRRWHGLTQREVADLTGSSGAAVRTREAGLHLPSPAALQRLERAYGLEHGALLATYPRR
ncbi:helix-turn-helix domain-containing protein [Nocardioides sp. B-3]|uniref:helix-turn-helix domain-containing protein n=1 Tax=Nocardioides sp. B-3 TaxID=2895565 RepID=UPI003FA53643